MHSTLSSIEIQRNPALAGLRAWLLDHFYSQHAAEHITAHVEAEGTPTGSAYLEAEDEAGATEAYVSALEPVAYDDPAWGDDEGRELEGFAAAWDAAWDRLEREDPALADIIENFRTPEDEAWWAEQDRQAEPFDTYGAMRAWYAANPISALNADRAD